MRQFHLNRTPANPLFIDKLFRRCDRIKSSTRRCLSCIETRPRCSKFRLVYRSNRNLVCTSFLTIYNEFSITLCSTGSLAATTATMTFMHIFIHSQRHPHTHTHNVQQFFFLSIYSLDLISLHLCTTSTMDGLHAICAPPPLVRLILCAHFLIALTRNDDKIRMFSF